jgi:uncharacterized protein with PIN domain
MNQATFRFYAELNDLLPDAKGREITYSFRGKPSVKDAIEAIGIPHTEVDLVLVNGESVDFAYQLRNGDRVSVYPVMESIDISGLTKVRPVPLRVMRFVLDGHLGRLAAYLRMMGFDSAYKNDCADEVLAEISRQERRILLTKDRGLLRRGLVTHGYCVRASAPRTQLREVMKRFDLYALARPFTLCMRCNGVLQEVDKAEVLHLLPEHVRESKQRFVRCKDCGGVYWKGSHYQRMMNLIEAVLEDAGPP